MYGRKKKARRAAVQKAAPEGYAVKRLCQIANLPRSSFYYHKQPKVKEAAELILRQRLQESQTMLDYTYGAKRMSHHLKRTYGETYNHKRVARAMSQWGLQAKIRRKRFPDSYYRTTKAKRENLPENLLNRDFSAIEPNKKLLTDTTCFRVKGGWLHLSTICDVFNNEIVSRRFSTRLDIPLALATLEALPMDKRLKGAIFHSDRGFAYTNPKFFKALTDMVFVQSLSRKQNPWDNAKMECFYGHLKSETIHRHGFLVFPEARVLQSKLERYIDFYNNERIQKGLGYRSPQEYRLSVTQPCVQ